MLGRPRITEIQEYASILRIIVLHNSLMTRIEVDGRTKGGLVPYLDIKTERKTRPTLMERILPDLRSEFKSLRDVHNKTEGLMHLVDRFIEINASKSLVCAIMECLAGITYLSPMSMASPFLVYSMVDHCPEWLQANMCLLLANCLAEPVFCDEECEPFRDKDKMIQMPSDYLFPLISTSSLETRNYTLGALANLSAQADMFDFVKGSGVFRILKPLPSRAYFAEHFKLMIEAVRILANMSCYPNAHMECATDNTIGFLRDVLRHVCAMLHSGLLGDVKTDPVYQRVDVEFTDDDAPPLGMRILWEQPPKLTEVLPGTPAARLVEALQKGDELIEVNGVDVTDMEHGEIAPMFETRPLHLLFRRLVPQ
jgi:hypothetical protein